MLGGIISIPSIRLHRVVLN